MNSHKKLSVILSQKQWNLRLFSLFLLTVVIVLSSSCVAPPDQSDGLLENIPAVVNEPDYFSLSILGDAYSESETWDLNFSANETDVVLTTLALKDVNVKATDSTYFQVLLAEGDTILSVLIQSDLVWSSLDSIANIGVPAIASFDGSNFTGRLEYQLLKNNNW
jgi:hypothetical protein